MRRGRRGYQLRAPWRRCDDPALSSIPLEALTFRRLTALAAFSIAISFIIWNYDLLYRKPGFVFPLYHYYTQSPNISGANGRGLQGVSPPFFKLREKFYVEMRLGVHAKVFYFNIDTGSRHSWVYCKVRGHILKNLQNLGPNGLFEPRYNTVVKCMGKNYDLCHDLQHSHIEPCNLKNNFECLFWVAYADNSRYRGAFVLESFKLPTRDNRIVQGSGVFGCVTEKEFPGERPPLFHDGLIGLGNCERTLVHQWIQRKLIKQNVVGICIAKVKQPELSNTRKQIDEQMGYVSVGVDFEKKFHKTNLLWAKLTKREGIDCGIIVTPLFIIFEGKNLNHLRSLSPTIDALMYFDTGTDITYLDPVFYDPLINAVWIRALLHIKTGFTSHVKQPYLFNDVVLWNIPNSTVSQTLRKQLDFYVMEKGYNSIPSDHQFRESDRRQCWSGHEDREISTIQSFPLLALAIKGMPSDPKGDQIRSLVLHPQNYLEWNDSNKMLCVNIVRTSDEEPGESIIGASQLREHLIVIDYDNQRIRWQQDSCVS